MENGLVRFEISYLDELGLLYKDNWDLPISEDEDLEVYILSFRGILDKIYNAELKKISYVLKNNRDL